MLISQEWGKGKHSSISQQQGQTLPPPPQPEASWELGIIANGSLRTRAIIMVKVAARLCHPSTPSGAQRLMIVMTGFFPDRVRF